MPVPGSPTSMLIAFAGRPPPSTESRRGSPLESRSLIVTLCLCRTALVPSRSLTVETNCRGSSGFWRKASAPASSASSRASSAEIARQAGTPVSFSRRHSSTPDPPETRSSTTASCGRRCSNFSRRVVEIEGDDDVVALGVQEVLCELRRVRITLGEQDQQTGLRLAVAREAEVAAVVEALTQQTVGLRRPATPRRFAA